MNKKTTVLAISLLLFLSGCADQKEKEKTADAVTEQRIELLDLTEPQTQPMVEMEETASPAPVGLVMQSSAKVKKSMARGGMIMPPPPPVYNTESYDAKEENGFRVSQYSPLSTFSIDVDTASYANIRRFIRDGMVPPVGSVRLEEMINYFSYSYPEPKGDVPFSLATEVGPSPFHADYKLVQIGLKAKDIEKADLPSSNLVFLVDVSGSMNAANKLPLLQKSMKLLVSTLGKDDRVSIVSYAGADRVVLQPTAGDKKEQINRAIDSLRSGGSTHGSRGILTAYQLAQQSFMPKGNNRVILASDGDFNVGVTSRGELQKLIEKERESKVYLTVLGFGMGNFHDDTMEILADKGNGNYAYIDSLLEAKKVLIKERGGTLFTLARDVKIQVEFNPDFVGAYRLIGYENRLLNNEDFADDKKDAGEIGSGHTVTALYELIPAGHTDVPRVDELKYQKPASSSKSEELLTVKLRYKPQGDEKSKLLSVTVKDNSIEFLKMSDDFRFATAVAGFGMLLKDSEHVGRFSWEQCLEQIRGAKGQDSEGYRAELFRLVEMAQLIKDKG